jgi:hypothetical protein
MRTEGPNPRPSNATIAPPFSQEEARAVSRAASVRYKETPKGPADTMQASGPNPCPARVPQGATNLPQVSPTTCSTQADLASNMYKPRNDRMRGQERTRTQLTQTRT